MTTATRRMTLDEFLELPETEPPSEFICGEVVQKPMPNLYHGIIVGLLIRRLGNFLEAGATGWAVTEVRHADREEQRAYLPDVGVILTDHIPKARRQRFRGPIEAVPDIAIEVLSPDDRPGRVAEKLAFYLRAGVPLVWIIDPLERSLVAHRPGKPSTFHSPPEKVTAEPVLPGFALDLAELFSLPGLQD